MPEQISIARVRRKSTSRGVILMKTKYFRFMDIPAIRVRIFPLNGEKYIYIELPISQFSINEAENLAKVILDAVAYARGK